MGSGESKPPAPPRVIQEPYPTQTGLSNLSLAPGITSACFRCDIGIDARASTSSVKLMRDFGNISDSECGRYQIHLDAVKNNEMSFRDFFTNLQAGNYSRPVSKNAKGQSFCEQVMFTEEDAAKVTDLASYNANVSKLKAIRIRQVTGGGSFSSGTKAKFKLSIPLKAKYVSRINATSGSTTELVRKGSPPKLQWQTTPTTAGSAELEDFSIASFSMYHPSPLRIENVQHDAVLSLNDPSDPTATVIILIPLKASNTGEESVDFFGKLAKHLTTITQPDSVTGLYPETDIPTGNDWNIKQVFWLGEAGSDNVATVTDAFYTWMGAGAYKRVELSRNVPGVTVGGVSFPTGGGEIRMGWEPDGKQVRYFMLQTPVAISTTDLSFLTRSLPATPAEEAIHTIPDPAAPGGSNPKMLYKKATGPGASASCGVVRERMSNPGQGDILSSLFTGGGAEDLLVDDKGAPLSDKDSCDPFKANAKRALANPSPFSPSKAAAFVFNGLILIALALGAWIGLYFVANKDYEIAFKDFAADAGKVLGTLALQTSGRVKDSVYAVTSTGPKPAEVPPAPSKIARSDASPANSEYDRDFVPGASHYTNW
jgi:hypothetical protein